MSLGRDPVKGELVITDLPETLKWGKPRDFVKLLTKILAVTLPFAKSSDFVVYGSQTPTEDDKNKLWTASQKQGSFLGFFLFQKGAWRRIFNRLDNEVIWLPGDSRNIPKGHQLIDGTLSGITVANQQHIMTFYRQDPAIIPPAPPVYTYFAVRWVGY